MIVSPQERFQQSAILFQEALSLPPGPAREACLNAKCGADAGLRREVASLLESDAAVRQRASSAPSRLPRFGIYQARERTGTSGTAAEGPPVQAANAGRSHRMWKFVSRHKSAFAAVTLLTLLLVAGLLAMRREARAAERRYADARELVRCVQIDLRKSVASVSAALRKTVESGNAGARLRPQLPEALIALATHYSRMGDMAEWRDRPAAVAFYRQALGVLDRIPAKDREAPPARNARVSALLGLGWNLGSLRAFTPALAALQEARQIRGRMSDEDLESTTALYFQAIRNHKGAPLPSSQRYQSGLGPDHNKKSSGSTPPVPPPTATGSKPAGPLTGIQRWEWINVLNLP